MTRLQPRSVGVSVIAALVVAACAAPVAPPAASSVTAPAWASATPTAPAARTILLAGQPMTRCPIGVAMALCGTLAVPEDRADPAGRSIGLKVAVIPAIVDDPEPDPLVALAGGPGDAASEAFTWLSSTFTDIHTTRDIVLVDQRGTGGSNKLVIPDPPDWGDRSATEREALLTDWTADAIARLDGDPRQYTTSVAMDDLDAVRAALGYERINLYGPSYGATAAQYYLRQHPDRVRSAILDGGTLVDVPIFERIARNSQRALDLVLDRCEAQADCAAAYPDIRADLETVLARLAEGPITVPTPGGHDPIVIDAPSFASSIHTGLVDASLAAYIPAFLHLAATEDWPALTALLDSLAGVGQAGGQSLVMSEVIRCSEAWARFDPAEVRRTAGGSYLTEVEYADAVSQAATCNAVPRGIVPPDDAEPVRSDLPILLVLGDADPQDPPPNVADAPTEMPNSRTIAVPGLGHTVGHLGCLPSVIAAFVDAGSASALDTSCVRAMSPPPFVVP